MKNQTNPKKETVKITLPPNTRPLQLPQRMRVRGCPSLTSQVVQRCAQHGADEHYLDSIELLHGPEYLKLFIEQAMNTEPGTTTKETVLEIAIDKVIVAEGVPCPPGTKVVPFRFCSP